MKIALLSDIHANRPALAACLEHARGQGAERFALLGDLVGYGGEPAAVLDDIMALAAQGAWVVLGNHDAMALAPPRRPPAAGRWARSGRTTSSSPGMWRFYSRCP